MRDRDTGLQGRKRGSSGREDQGTYEDEHREPWSDKEQLAVSLGPAEWHAGFVTRASRAADSPAIAKEHRQ